MKDLVDSIATMGTFGVSVLMALIGTKRTRSVFADAKSGHS